jgi:hypothetical protein
MQIKKRVTKNMAQKRNNNINLQGLHRTKFSEILRERVHWKFETAIQLTMTKKMAAFNTFYYKALRSEICV